MQQKQLVDVIFQLQRSSNAFACSLLFLSMTIHIATKVSLSLSLICPNRYTNCKLIIMVLLRDVAL